MRNLNGIGVNKSRAVILICLQIQKFFQIQLLGLKVR
jgi:hypothetical protein